MTQEPVEIALSELVTILKEALAATPWLARMASAGTATRELHVVVGLDDEGSQLQFAAMNAQEDVVEIWSYCDLGRLRVTPQRMVAYSSCVAQIIARALTTERLAEQIPSPVLLAIPELLTAEDFQRERFNVELEERAAAQLGKRCE